MSKPRDWTGIRLGKLVYVKPTDEKIDRRIVWECKCDCGRAIYRVPRTGIQSCGCKWKPNWSGQKYNMLTILRPTDNRTKQKSILWEAQCDCGNIILVKPKKVKAGEYKSCGKCGFGIRKHTPYISSATSVWRSRYNDGDIILDDFIRLSQLPCDYCKRLPFLVFNVADNATSGYTSEHQKQEGNFTYNGLDRIDSSRGHMLDNVVSCCYPCNWMKGDKTRYEFLSHIERVYHGTTDMRALLMPPS